MTTPVDALAPAVALLGMGTAAVLASRALKISPIVGYLIAGVAIGPHAIGLIEENDATHLLAELGVVFLLFDIGMHVSLRELRESGRDLASLAPAHMALNGVAFTAALGLLGLAWPLAIAIGLSLALSSTAVVGSILSERDLKSCPLGRSSVNVLIFQDIVAIFLLIYANSLASGAERIAETMALAAGQALVAFAAALLAGRYLIGPVFRALASTRNEEAFTAFSLLLALGAALATAATGLSLTLGAFLAGLAVSGTPFRHQIQTETAPFRGLLLSFFFINVGMLIDVPQLLANLPLVIGATLGILVAKTVIGLAAARLSGWTLPGATQLAFLLAQGSEFTLVVLSLAALMAGMPPLVETVIVAAVALTLAAAPSWAGLGMRLARALAQRATTNEEKQARPEDRPVIVFGLTPPGRLAVDALKDMQVPYVALDSDPERFMAAVADGYQVSFGDASNLKLIDAIGASNARAVVIGAPRYEVSKSITPAVESTFPGILRFVAVETPEDVARFRQLGMSAHLARLEPVGVEMVADLLQSLDVKSDAIADWLRAESERFDLDDLSERVLDPTDEPIEQAAA